MRALSPGLNAALLSGVTTLCQCWRVYRRDGLAFGFTDHDRDLLLGDVLCRARSGLTAGQLESALGLSVPSSEVAGALSDDGLTESDLSGGAFDGASIETWMVDWSNVDQRVLMDVGVLGEVRRTDQSFQVEIRGVAHQFNQEKGRVYQSSCSANLGDQACSIDVSSSQYSSVGIVRTIGNQTTLTVEIGACASDWFSSGQLIGLSGLAAGVAVLIRDHEQNGLIATLRLWGAGDGAFKVGDQVRLVVGCDKHFSTCKSKFSNQINFRGCPHIPGNVFCSLMPINRR